LDAYVEENLTNYEKARADALEAIISYKNLKDARKKQKGIVSQLFFLSKEQPVKFGNQFDLDFPED